MGEKCIVASLTLIFCLMGLLSCGSTIDPKKQAKISGLFPIMQGGKYGYINKNGEIAIKVQFDNAGEFSDGMAVVTKVYRCDRSFRTNG